MSDAAWAAATFALDRWVRRPGKVAHDRAHDHAHDKALQRFLARDLPAAPFYAP